MDSSDVELKDCLEELKDLQQQHDILESQCHDEISRIEAEYMRSIEPICSERLRMVSWTDATAGGICRFWLTVIATAEDYKNQEKITHHRDEEALAFLTDIKWSPLNDHKGWKLDFYFDSDNNPFFDNSVLTKCVYFSSMVRGRRCIEKITGTEINWYPGECLLQKTVKRLNKKVLVKVDSFFDFFTQDRDSINNVEECDHLIDLCHKFMIMFIPHAHLIFTFGLQYYNKLETEYAFLSNGANKRHRHEDEILQFRLQIEKFESKMMQRVREVDDLYWESVKPLHERRSALVDEFLVVQRSRKDGEEKRTGKLGPAFWLNAMRGEETLGSMISERDANALRYLKNIEFSKHVEARGLSIAHRYTWKLEFLFNPNPHFRNAALTKEMDIVYLKGLCGPMSTKGTEIEWLPGGFLLDDPEQVGTVESFFNLFDGSSDEGYSKEDLQRDYKTCQIIFKRIICHAASFYLDSL